MTHATPALLLTLILTVAALAEGDKPLRKTTETGPVKAVIELTPEQPTIGDPVTLTLTVTADRDVELIMPQFGEALERFTILGFVPRSKVDSDGNNIAIQEYRLQSPMSGEHVIPPILVEFVDRRPNAKPAPDDMDAYELLTERIEFKVDSVLPNDADAELRPPLGQLEKLEPPAPPIWPYVIGGIFLIVLIAPFAWKRLQEHLRLARRRSAYDIAAVELYYLLRTSPPPDDELEAFYVKLSNIIRTYLENRFDLRSPELTTEEFFTLVKDSPDLTNDHKKLLHDFLRQADLVKFARFVPTKEQIEESINTAQRFLEDTREDAPLIDEPTQEVATNA